LPPNQNVGVSNPTIISEKCLVINGTDGCLVKMYVQNVGKLCTFLIDTGSDISIFKQQLITNLDNVDTTSSCNIIGVTSNTIKTIGLATLILKQNEHAKIEYNFQIVSEKFPIEVDGIIGRDFIKDFQCNIDYKNFTFSVQTNKLLWKFPILDAVVIPARCRVVRKVNLNITEDSLLEPQAIDKGIMSAQAVISNDSYVEFLNATENNYILYNFKPKVLPLSSFWLAVQNDKPKHVNVVKTHDRKQKLLQVLNLDKVPEFATQRIKNLCLEFSDIFHLENEPITSNNFYEQKISLTDGIPTYIKNYRIPQSHKAIIENEVNNLLKNDIIEHSYSPYNSPLLHSSSKKRGRRKSCSGF
jgi:Retroviral aspartyl protease